MGLSRSDIRKLDIVFDQGKEMVDFYRAHPCQAAYDLLRVDFAPIQRLVFRDMWFKNYVIAVMGRGNGKTFMLGTLAALGSLLYPGYRVGLIGPVFRQSFPIIPDTYDTFWTSDGLQTTAQGFYNSIEEGVTKTQSLKTQNTILSKWENPERACRSIKTTKGFELAGTVDHEILILSNELDLVFKDLQDITEEDNIVIKKGFKYFGNDNSMPTFDEFEHNWRTKDCLVPEKLTPDLAYWMGLLSGDGCVSISKNKRKQRVSFVNEDQDLLDSFENCLREYFLINKDENIDRRNRRNKTWEIQYFCKKLVNYLLKCGFTKTTALDKKIPGVIKKSSQECVKQFLIGLMDTDGCVYIQKNKACEIAFNTSSMQLAKEVQACFLNFGIIANLGISKKAEVRQLSEGNKPSKCAEAYKVRITGLPDLFRFREEIGFKCLHKKDKLDNYLNNVSGKTSSADRIPGTSNAVKLLAMACKDKVKRGNGDVAILGKIINNTDHSDNITKERIEKVFSLAEKYDIRTHDYYKLKNIIDLGLSFVKMTDSDYFFAPTIDAEVENESCYWSNGFISHNSKMIFSEVEKLYSRAPILKEATEKRPTRGSDTCYLKFKSIGGYNGSFIEALPLGDGGKIRGSRFYLILIDELAQVPDKVLDMVVRPMGATVLEPMENVRRIEKQLRLIEMGLATEDDFEDSTVNKMVMTSSGYFKFNHMWRRMKDYWLQMEKEGDDACQYKVWQVPFWDLPPGFLDLNNIEEAKRIMSHAEYRMEYEAEMISDSEGFFKASLIESCSAGSGFTIELQGDPDAEYVVGVDPSQGGAASCGVVIIRLGTQNKVVNVMELKRKTHQELTQTIQKICEQFKVIRIFMDKGGGGKAVCDLLEEGYDGKTPIIDRTNEDHKQIKGRHILEMVTFNPAWISDANFTTLSLMEDKRLLFPEAPVRTTLDAVGIIFDNVKMLKSQMLNIIVTQTRSGLLHFDTPTKSQNKDLYSALILAGHGVRMLEKELEGYAEPELYVLGGMIKERKPNASWNPIHKGSTGISSNIGLSAAILKKK